MTDSIAETIKTLRLSRNLSLQQLGDAIGVSKAHVWELEAGKSANPTVSLVKRIASFFGVPVASLIHGEYPLPSDYKHPMWSLWQEINRLETEDVRLVQVMVKAMNDRRNPS